MMSNDRLWDDSIFQPRDPGVDPWHVRQLVKELGVEREPLSVRANAVRKWLETNTTTPTLRMSLRRSPYAYILQEIEER